MAVKAIVTGGNGYVGNALVRRLLFQGIEVHAVVNRNSDRLERLLPTSAIHPCASDMAAVTELVRTLEPSVIYHLAAVHSEPPDLDDILAMLDCDITFGTALLHGATLCNSHPAFVNIGTYWQFGEASNEYAPNTFYAAAKRAMHGILEYFRKTRDIGALTLVLYDVFGPDDHRPKLWNKLGRVPAGSVFPVTEGRQYVELVHVDDVVRAILLAGEKLSNGVSLESVYSVASMERMTLRQALERVRDLAGLEIQFAWGAVPYQADQTFVPWTGNPLPGWEPTVPPIEALANLIAGVPVQR